MSILYDIYNDAYHAQEHRPKLPKEIQEQDLAFWEKVTEALGADYVDQHLYRLSEKEHLTDYDHFREGFRLGVQLMLEAIGTH